MKSIKKILAWLLLILCFLLFVFLLAEGDTAKMIMGLSIIGLACLISFVIGWAISIIVEN